MSSNVITPMQFQKKKTKKVSVIPNLFSNLLKQYKAKQDELRKKKIDFLIKEAYQYYYDLLEFSQIADIDLPAFIYEEQRKKSAYQKANKALLDVIADGRLDECYRKRMNELKNRG